MITFTALLAEVPAVDADRLTYWISQDWVRPVRQEGQILFTEIDVARLRLILDLQDMEVGESAVPVVLSLLDQLHATRRQMRLVLDALDKEGADAVLRRLKVR